MTNTIIINTATAMSFGALTAIALGSPIGATGGALLGFCNFVTTQITDRLIKHNQSDSSFIQIAKTIATVCIIFFSGWKLGAASGINMSLKSWTVLSSASWGLSVAVGTIIKIIYAGNKKSDITANING